MSEPLRTISERETHGTYREGQVLGGPFRHSLEALQKDWWCFLVLGGSLLALGLLAIGGAFYASVVTVVLFGLVLLAAGIAQIVSTIWAGRWDGFLLDLLVGILYTVTGAFIMHAPIEATRAMTLLLAAMLLVNGLFRMAAALSLRFSLWGWTLLHGFVSVLLAMMIYREWPASGELAIGLFVGIDLLFAGLTWTMVALALRKLTKAV
jgi:uncharacterized membrane protein HdeD (DUF308 family)